MRATSLLFILVFMCPSWLIASENNDLMKMEVNLHNKKYLHSGARTFMNYCLSCHSAAYMRYNRMGIDLGITEGVLKSNFMFDPATKVGDPMTVAMSKDDGVRYFGVAPPDLSVIARSRGADWLYTYLKTFYVDPDRPFGVNNLVFRNTSMPHVLWELQGLQNPVYKTEITGEGSEIETIERLELAVPGTKTEEEYDRIVRDLVNFLVYLGEPIKLKRKKIGGWVLFYLSLLFVVCYFLKKEYWRDIN